MYRLERAAAEHECLRAIKLFYQIIDAHDHKGALGLLADSIVWFRAGRTLTGKEEVAAVLATRNPYMHIRHLVSNETVLLHSPTEATASYCITSYRVDAEKGSTTTPTTPGCSVFDCTDRLILTDSGWKFTFRDAVPVFLKGRA